MKNRLISSFVRRNAATFPQADHEIDIWLPESTAPPAVRALEQAFPDLGRYRTRREDLAPRDLAHALNRLRCHAYRSFGDGVVRLLFLSGIRQHDEKVLLAIAPFVPEGSTAVFENGNGTKTEWSFTKDGIIVSSIQPLAPRTAPMTLEGRSAARSAPDQVGLA